MRMLTCNDFEKIVIEETPLIDVRAPIEFEKGSFKNAVNLPLMNDEERRLVGICYKEKGNEEAVKLGHHLVSGEIRQARIDAWLNHLREYPDSMVCCFRGGLRSQISQQWITEAAGREIVRLEGGYKAFRNYLIEELDPSRQRSKPILIGGCTGSGKTILLKKLQNAIDLEGLANHRGSSFGRQVTSQPTQINFENNLAYALIVHRSKAYPYMILEDEGANIGKCFIPKPLAAYFNSGDRVIVKVPLEERVQITMDEYVYESQKAYVEMYSKDLGLSEWADYIRASLRKIEKRLGGDRCKKVIDLFEKAYEEQINSGTYALHKSWIETLLRDYYDPMYEYQIQKAAYKVICEGDTKEVLAYLEDKCSVNAAL
ncbi:MAG: selU [Clostridia bacterium]|jgi:tRNA 2-selenouridine synthase|nr:selU [Clostridia bacterium]